MLRAQNAYINKPSSSLEVDLNQSIKNPHKATNAARRNRSQRHLKGSKPCIASDTERLMYARGICGGYYHTTSILPPPLPLLLPLLPRCPTLLYFYSTTSTTDTTTSTTITTTPRALPWLPLLILIPLPPPPPPPSHTYDDYGYGE